jgi:SNF2 family DNA or RNA helicase
MGLGKTIQAISALLELVKSGEVLHCLVIAPRSLLFNWLVELDRWAPELASSILVPGSKGGSEIWQRRLGKSHVVITSYEQLRAAGPIFEFEFDLVIADEAHRLRNRESAQSKGFRLFRARRIWFLSGTPLERDPEDLITLMSLLKPDLFSPRDIKLGAAFVRAKAQRFILRRKKNDVLKDLPELVRNHEYIELNDLQRDEYKQSSAWSRSEDQLVRFMKLREICDLSVADKSSSKLDRIREIVNEIVLNGENVVVFSFWNSTLQHLASLFEGDHPGLVRVYSSDLSIEKRNEVVTNFKSNGGIFLASGHIAAEGLTLTEANHAIFANRWWNPSLNRQAEDRIRRIGQGKTTFVYTFSAPGTVEELLDDMLEEKSLSERDFVELLSSKQFG